MSPRTWPDGGRGDAFWIGVLAVCLLALPRVLAWAWLALVGK